MQCPMQSLELGLRFYISDSCLGKKRMVVCRYHSEYSALVIFFYLLVFLLFFGFFIIIIITKWEMAILRPFPPNSPQILRSKYCVQT